MLAACEASGLSMRAFAVREGLRPRRLYWWTQRLGNLARGRRGEEGGLRFVPAIMKVAVPGRGTGPVVTIRMGAKTTLEIVEPSAVSAGWVAEVMVELERITCS